jgi:hypothetical protein
MSHKHSSMASTVIMGMAVACLILAVLSCTTFLSDFKTRTQDTTSIAAACFAITAVVSLMPFNLAPVLANRQSEQFKQVVKSGVQMSLSSVCFRASAMIKYWLFAHSGNSHNILEFAAYFFSVILFAHAVAMGLWGLFKFTEALAHECYCNQAVGDEEQRRLANLVHTELSL